MGDDLSFDELLELSSLGSAGARGLREKTSPDTARLVLRIVELRQALESVSSETEALSLVRLGDDLAGAIEELQKTGAGRAPNLVRMAHSLARAGSHHQALTLLAEAKGVFDETDDWPGSAQVLTARCALLLRSGDTAEALEVLHELSRLLASHTESGARVGTLPSHLDRAPRRPRTRTRRVRRREAGLSSDVAVAVEAASADASDVAVTVQAASADASDIEVTVQASTSRFALEDQRWVEQVASLHAELQREAGVTLLRSAPRSRGTAPAEEAVTLRLGSRGELTAAVACFRAWLARDETRTLTVTWTDGRGAEQRLTISGDRVDQAAFQPLTEAGDKRFTGRKGLSARRRRSGGSLPGTNL